MYFSVQWSFVTRTKMNFKLPIDLNALKSIYLWDTFLYHVHFEMAHNLEEESAIGAIFVIGIVLYWWLFNMCHL